MSWLKQRLLGDPKAVAEYRRAQQALRSYLPSTNEQDETMWRLDMRVVELQRTVPYLRR